MLLRLCCKLLKLLPRKHEHLGEVFYHGGAGRGVADVGTANEGEFAPADCSTPSSHVGVTHGAQALVAADFTIFAAVLGHKAGAVTKLAVHISLAVYQNSLAELGPSNVAHDAHDARTSFLQNKSVPPTTAVSAGFTKCCRRWRQSSLNNRLGGGGFLITLPPAPVLPEAGCVCVSVVASPAAAAGSWLVAGAEAVTARFCRRRYTGIRES